MNRQRADTGYYHFFLVLIGLCIFTGSSFARDKQCTSLYEELSDKHNTVLANIARDDPSFNERMHKLEDELFKALDQCKRDPLLFCVMVENQVSLGNIQLAHVYASQAYNRRPEIWQTNHALGTTLCMLNDCDKGITFLEKAVEIEPHRPALVFNLCSTYLNNKQFQRAVDTCTNLLAMKQHQLHGPAYFLRSLAYQELGKSQKARSDYNRAKVLGFIEENKNGK